MGLKYILSYILIIITFTVKIGSTSDNAKASESRLLELTVGSDDLINAAIQSEVAPVCHKGPSNQHLISSIVKLAKHRFSIGLLSRFCNKELLFSIS